MPGLLILLAHPQLQHSRVSRAMMSAARTVDRVIVHDLYELYPDFHIDIKREQELLASVKQIVLQFPLQWYSCPSLMKEWLDVVLEYGWAYGQNATALQGKSLQCAVTIGGSERAYQAGGRNKYTIDEFLRPFEQTALLCGMEYVPPFVFYHSLKAETKTIEAHAQEYKKLLTKTCEQRNE